LDGNKTLPRKYEEKQNSMVTNIFAILSENIALMEIS
jgi:hypothetical protein